MKISRYFDYVWDLFHKVLKGFWLSIGIFILICIGGLSCVAIVNLLSKNPSSLTSLRGDGSILVLDLDGMILSADDFLDDLNKYIKEDKIKGVLIRINSPGGAVAPSEELYKGILRAKKKYEKPVVISVGSVGASGGFYVSMAGDKIVANESSILGSIGVIMYLFNLEDLYEWAKIQPYVVKTGEFKDSGSDFRSLTPRERDLFQDVLDQTLAQFKEAIVESRSLSEELVDEFSDGRIFLGETALIQGFIDQVGTYRDALSIIGKMTELGEDPKIFEPPEKIEGFWRELFFTFVSEIFPSAISIDLHWRHQQLRAQPLYIMPERLGL